MRRFSPRNRLGLSSRQLVLLSLFAHGASAQCQRLVQMPEHSLCVPANCVVDREEDARSDRIMACKLNAGRCAKNKDIHPYSGVVMVDVQVADRGYDVWKSPEDLIARAQLLGEPAPFVYDVMLNQSGASKRTCWVARVLEYGDLWDEMYGLTVDGRRFMVHVFYNDESANIESFRAAVIDILSSVRITSRK